MGITKRNGRRPYSTIKRTIGEFSHNTFFARASIQLFNAFNRLLGYLSNLAVENRPLPHTCLHGIQRLKKAAWFALYLLL
jgi:hypothetical protein